ncbi:MAG: hypothetical protein ACLTBV_23160 [Enterocloster bolteae]
MIRGFDCRDAILAGMESRTSSPRSHSQGRNHGEQREGHSIHAERGPGTQGESPPPPWTESRSRRELIRRYGLLSRLTGRTCRREEEIDGL